MRQKYILERLLLQYIASASTMHAKRIPIFEGITLPANMKFTQEFIDIYSQVAQKIILHKLSDVFGWREFYFCKDDVTTRSNVAQPYFWNNIHFSLTQNGANALWRHFSKQQCTWELVSPWDAVLVHSFFSNTTHGCYTPQWLIDNKAHWAVNAYFMIKSSENLVYTKLPYSPYLRNPQNVPFTLRFLLIELSASYYKRLVELLEDVQKDSLEGNWASGYRFNLDLRDRKFWTWLENMESHLGINAMKEAYNYWCHDGIIGYDDSDFLQKHEREHGLFKSIGGLQELKKSLGSVGAL